MAVSAVRKYFILGGCCGLASKIYFFERCGSPAITRASYGQINGSNEVALGISLARTVLFLPVRWLKAKTNWVHPRRLGVFIFGRVCWS